jgi:hypothetical protein
MVVEYCKGCYNKGPFVRVILQKPHQCVSSSQGALGLGCENTMNNSILDARDINILELGANYSLILLENILLLLLHNKVLFWLILLSH